MFIGYDLLCFIFLEKDHLLPFCIVTRLDTVIFIILFILFNLDNVPF